MCTWAAAFGPSLELLWGHRGKREVCLATAHRRWVGLRVFLPLWLYTGE